MTGSEPIRATVLGERVRELRTQRNLSQSALAVAAGIGKGSLSELEAGQRNPTLATLYALAAPLGVSLATLLADRIGTEVSSGGLTARLLDSDRASDGTGVEIYRLHGVAGADRCSPAHGPGVAEHLVITEGRLEVSHGDRVDLLTPGDALTFASDRPHRYRVPAGPDCQAVLVIRTPPR